MAATLLLDAEGWAGVEGICRLWEVSRVSGTAADLRHIVEHDDVNRFELEERRGVLRMCAVQGWSSGAGLPPGAGLTRVFPETLPEFLYPGSYSGYEASIIENGLLCSEDLASIGVGDRLYVHWCAGTSDYKSCRIRSDAEVVVVCRPAILQASGVTLYATPQYGGGAETLSVLTKNVRPELIERIIEYKSGLPTLPWLEETGRRRLVAVREGELAREAAALVRRSEEVRERISASAEPSTGPAQGSEAAASAEPTPESKAATFVAPAPRAGEVASSSGPRNALVFGVPTPTEVVGPSGPEVVLVTVFRTVEEALAATGGEPSPPGPVEHSSLEADVSLPDAEEEIEQGIDDVTKEVRRDLALAEEVLEREEPAGEFIPEARSPVLSRRTVQRSALSTRPCGTNT